jgi:hypothetical protein
MVFRHAFVGSRHINGRLFHTAIGLLCLFSGVVAASQPQPVKRPAPVNQPHEAASATRAIGLSSSYGKLPLAFEVNQGQTASQVKFLSHGTGYSLFLTGDQAVLTLKGGSKNANRADKTPSAKAIAEKGGSLKLKAEDSRRTSTLRMKLLGANRGAAVMGQAELSGRSNYFIGNDPKKWHTDVPNYAEVRYQDVYPGVDLVYYGNQGGQLEYDFVVAPGADPNSIKLDIAADTVRPSKGQRPSSLRMASHGNLLVETGGGEVRFQKPVVYQEQSTSRHSLDGRYVLRGRHGVGFEVAAYDHRKPLVIDPVLSYSTYLGGNAVDAGTGIATDSAGNAYITGVTDSSNFPTANPFQAAQGAADDDTAFVTKLNPSGTALVYSTYLGGSSMGSATDWGTAIAVDSAGSAYVTGYTSNTNFPTANPFQASLNGASNAYVTKLSAAGDALVYSTYLGGSGTDRGLGITVDSAGSAYVTGDTTSNNFPTVNSFQAASAGIENAFVTKLNATGGALDYSTYLGGSSEDHGYGIAVNSAGNAYVTGQVTSINFPLANPIQATCGVCTFGENGNAFVTELNAAGSALVYSTYLGGSVADEGWGIAVDSAGNVYVTGQTRSPDFPVVNAFQPVFGGGGDDAFVTKVNAAGSALVYSTYLGGYGDDVGYGIQVNSAGNAYVTGSTESPDFPTVNPLQAYLGTADDTLTAFVTELSAEGSAPIYSTYLGGSTFDSASAIAVDSAGNAYVTGSTESTDFPVVNAFEPALPGFENAFVAKIAPGGLITQTITFTQPTSPVTFASDLQIPLVATGGASENPVVFTIDSSSTATGSISDSTLTVASTGNLVIDANQAGNSSYSAAPQVQRKAEVNQAPQAINFTQPTSPVTFTSGLQISLSATGGASGNPVVFSIDESSTATGSIMGSTLTVTSTGNLVIDANQAGNTNYSAAPQVQRTVVVTTLIAQAINFTQPTTPVTYSSGLTIPLVATGGASENPVVFTLDASSKGAGSISGGTLTATSVGSFVIDANQAGNATYAAAPQVQRTVVVNQAPQAINFTQPTSPVTFTSGLQISLSATGGASGNPVVFTIDESSTATGSISGSTLTVTSTGNLVIDANQAGNTDYSAAPKVQRTITMNAPAPDFSVTATPPSQSIEPGASAMYPVTVADVGSSFTSAVTLSVSGLPTGATGTFSPAMVTPDSESGSSTLTVTTAAVASLVRPNLWPMATPVLALLFVLPFRRWRKAWKGNLLLLVAALASLAGTASLMGCGAGFGLKTSQTYTLTITGTSGTDTHSTTVQLTVQ